MLTDKFKFLAAALTAASLLAACGGGGGADPGGTTTTDSSGTPGSVKYDPPLGVTAMTAAQFKASLEGAGATGASLLQLAGTPTCGVDIRYIEYGTVGGAGEATNASGALIVPTGSEPACSGKRPVVLYAHGTSADRNYNLADVTDTSRPGASEGLLLAALYAAQGFIVVAPNYAGYDSSQLGYHPFLNADQQSKEMIDVLTAARKVMGDRDSGQLFVTGYSEGGHVAMATVRAMQKAGMKVTASAPSSGPYAMAAFGDAVFYGNVNLGSTVFVPLITTSYQKAYGNLYRQTSDIYEAAYATGIETVLPSTSPFATLVAQGKLPQTALFSSIPPATGDTATDGLLAAITPPTGTGATDALFALGFGDKNLINNQTRLAYLSDAMTNPDGVVPAPSTGLPAATAPTNPLRQALWKNDLRGQWAPASPMLLCAGNADPTVFYSINTGVMAQLWAPYVSAGLVTVLDMSSFNPANTADPFYQLKGGFAQTLGAMPATQQVQSYHSTLAPFCGVAARGFFQQVLASGA